MPRPISATAKTVPPKTMIRIANATHGIATSDPRARSRSRRAGAGGAAPLARVGAAHRPP